MPHEEVPGKEIPIPAQAAEERTGDLGSHIDSEELEEALRTEEIQYDDKESNTDPSHLERVPAKERVSRIKDCLHYYTMLSEAIPCQETVQAAAKRKMWCSDNTKVMEGLSTKKKVPESPRLSHDTSMFCEATTSKNMS